MRAIRLHARGGPEQIMYEDAPLPAPARPAAHRDKLVELLGAGRGKSVRHAEAFEVCDYGTQPTREELLRLFPFFGAE